MLHRDNNQSLKLLILGHFYYQEVYVKLWCWGVAMRSTHVHLIQRKANKTCLDLSQVKVHFGSLIKTYLFGLRKAFIYGKCWINTLLSYDIKGSLRNILGCYCISVRFFTCSPHIRPELVVLRANNCCQTLNPRQFKQVAVKQSSRMYQENFSG